MAFDAEKMPTLTDQQLKALDENVARLGLSGTPAQRKEAERLAPLIAEERETRRAAKSAALASAAAARRKPKA